MERLFRNNPERNVERDADEDEGDGDEQYEFELNPGRDMVGRMRREYFPRIHPFLRYHEAKFQARYRLSKEIARNLADEFGRSQYATWGMPMGGGLSHQDRVTKLFIMCKKRSLL